MASTHRMLIRIEASQASWFEQHHGRRFEPGSWVEVEDASRAERANARTFSSLLHATVAELELQSTVEQVWIHGYIDGELARELLSVDGAWQIVEGEPFDFEDGPAVRRWLARKRFSSEHGEALFEALLGKGSVVAGRVESRHLRADIPPEQVKADLAAAEALVRAHLETTNRAAAQVSAGCHALSKALKEQTFALFLLAEPRHRWASAEGFRPPVWIPSDAELPPDVVSITLGCLVVSCQAQKYTQHITISVLDGERHVRSVQWILGTWILEGEPQAFEAPAALARFTSSEAEPNVSALCRAFLGAAHPLSETSLPAEALQRLLDRKPGSRRRSRG